MLIIMAPSICHELLSKNNNIQIYKNDKCKNFNMSYFQYNHYNGGKLINTLKFYLNQY